MIDELSGEDFKARRAFPGKARLLSLAGIIEDCSGHDI